MANLNVRKDLYNSEKTFNNWIQRVSESGIPGISKENSNLLLKFINDFSLGLNIAKGSQKGSRSKTRLNSLRQKLIFVFKNLESRNIGDIRNAKAEDLHKLFDDMSTGVIQTYKGTPFKSTGDYIKNMKTFWHWYMKIKKKEGIQLEDTTEELDKRGEKPKFVYFTKEDFELMLQNAEYDTKIIMALAFDSGARVTELMNVKVSDFSDDFKELNIREETSKTFGRKIKIMLCSEQIKEYVKKLNLTSNDFLCKKHQAIINKELRNLGKEYLTPEQIKYKNLTMYDFRHSSCCFWLPRYKSESALKYRFGWKKSDMIFYYSEFLGMRDTIKQDDMYIDITKADLEKEMDNLKRINQSLIIEQENQKRKLFQLTKQVAKMLNIN